MTGKNDNDRTETARRHDDSEMIEDAIAAPSGATRSGGTLAQDVGTRDEERQVTEDTGITRVEKRDKLQPNPGQRSDNEGARS